MKTRTLLLLLSLFPCFVLAADVTGIWKAEFDTQIGLQKYIYTLKQDGTKVTGKANVDIAGEKREAELKEGKLDGDTLSFVEMLSFQGNEIRITYKGKVTADEIKFTREVGEFAKEEFTAKREAPPAPSAPPARAAQRGRGYQSIVLSSDDKPFAPAAPEDFNSPRDSIHPGKD